MTNVTKSQQKKLRSVSSILATSARTQQSRMLEKMQAQSVLLQTVQALLPTQSQTHCLSAQLQQDTLVVHVDSSAWAAKLRFQLAACLPALRRQPGYHLANKVSVRVQPQHASTQPDSGSRKTMPPQLAQYIRELGSAIRDEKLRERWIKLANNDTPENHNK